MTPPRRTSSSPGVAPGEVSSEELRAIVRRFPDVEVLVVGDLIADRFVWGDVDRISPEAPVPVVQVTSESRCLGGAANVAHNIRALGGRVTLGGLVGRDSSGEWVVRECKRLGIDPGAVVAVPGRRTTEKTRVVARHQQVVRFDHEDLADPTAATMGALSRALRKRLARAAAVVISDYAKGSLEPSVLRALIAEARRRRVPVLVDPKPPRVEIYRGATVVTPNLKEAAAMSGVAIADDRSLASAGRRIQRALACEAVLITRGEDGMTLLPKGGRATHIPTTARDVFDVTGAGDTVIGTFGLCEALGVERSVAARISNVAAGIVVGKVGTAVVSAAELSHALDGGGIRE